MKTEHQQAALQLLQANGLDLLTATAFVMALEQEDENDSLDDPATFTITMMVLVLELQSRSYEELARSFFTFLELDDGVMDLVIDALRDSIKQAPTDPQAFFIMLLLTASTLGLLESALPRIAAIRIQTTVRGYLARKRLHELKREKAATQIQAVFRGFQARKELEQRKQEEAAVVIQTAFRGFLARKQLQKLKQEQAVVKLQSSIRTQLAQKKLGEMKANVPLREKLLQCIAKHGQDFLGQIQTEKGDMPSFAIPDIQKTGEALLEQIRLDVIETFVTSPADLKAMEETLPTSLAKVEPKKIYIGIMLRWAEQRAVELNFKKKSQQWENAWGGIEQLRSLEEVAQERKWHVLIQLCIQCVNPLGKVSNLQSGRATSSLKTINRNAAGTAPQGRIHRKALREAKSTDRMDAMVAVVSGTVTNTRTGYVPTVLHWHVMGNAQDNIIFQGTSVLGFVGGHIDRQNKQNVITANNCEARRVDLDADFIPVAVIAGELRQLV